MDTTNSGEAYETFATVRAALETKWRGTNPFMRIDTWESAQRTIVKGSTQMTINITGLDKVDSVLLSPLPRGIIAQSSGFQAPQNALNALSANATPTRFSAKLTVHWRVNYVRWAMHSALNALYGGVVSLIWMLVVLVMLYLLYIGIRSSARDALATGRAFVGTIVARVWSSQSNDTAVDAANDERKNQPPPRSPPPGRVDKKSQSPSRSRKPFQPSANPNARCSSDTGYCETTDQLEFRDPSAANDNGDRET